MNCCLMIARTAGSASRFRFAVFPVLRKMVLSKDPLPEFKHEETFLLDPSFYRRILLFCLERCNDRCAGTGSIEHFSRSIFHC